MVSEGSVYQRKDGRWVGQYKDAKGKTRYVYRRTKAEAKKALRAAIKDRDDGFVPADRLTVGMHVDGGMDERKNTVSARTWRVQESIIRCRVKPHIGDKRLCKLVPAELNLDGLWASSGPRSGGRRVCHRRAGTRSPLLCLRQRAQPSTHARRASSRSKRRPASGMLPEPKTPVRTQEEALAAGGSSRPRRRADLGYPSQPSCRRTAETPRGPPSPGRRR